MTTATSLVDVKAAALKWRFPCQGPNTRDESPTSHMNHRRSTHTEVQTQHLPLLQDAHAHKENRLRAECVARHSARKLAFAPHAFRSSHGSGGGGSGGDDGRRQAAAQPTGNENAKTRLLTVLRMLLHGNMRKNHNYKYNAQNRPTSFFFACCFQPGNILNASRFILKTCSNSASAR